MSSTYRQVERVHECNTQVAADDMKCSPKAEYSGLMAILGIEVRWFGPRAYLGLNARAHTLQNGRKLDILSYLPLDLFTHPNCAAKEPSEFLQGEFQGEYPSQCVVRHADSL
jgi:hypothetical protein